MLFPRMDWLLPALIILSLASSSFQQKQTELRLSTAPPKRGISGPVRLECTPADRNFFDTGVFWLRQLKTTTRPECLLFHHVKTRLAPGVKEKFKCDKGSLSFSLSFTGFNEEDQATYFCLFNHNSMLYFSNGVQLYYPPSVTTLAPSSTSPLTSTSSLNSTSPLKTTVRHSKNCSCLEEPLAGVHSSTELSQNPKFAMALKNNSTEIQCKMRGLQRDQYAVNWYRRSQEDLEFILGSTTVSKNNYGSKDFVNRFTASKDFFQNMDTLKLTDLRPEDSGTYYCAVVHPSATMFGDGTELAVVDFIPTTSRASSPSKPTKRTPQCWCESSNPGPGVFCSVSIWAPLVVGVVVLLISLALMINHLHYFNRRYRRHFIK